MPRRLIQVGLGDFGRRWLRAVSESSRWEYAGLVTRNAAVRAECGRQVGVPASGQFATLEEAVGAGIEADAALVTTPHFCHAHDVSIALEQGWNVLVEKPLAGSWSDCLTIRAAARRAAGSVMVAENYRFGEGAGIMRDLVRSGEIGEPEFLTVDYFVGHEFAAGDWRNDYRYPLLIENATHQFDLARFVTGTNAESVFCSAVPSARTPQWAYPTVSVQFAMQSGLHFHFSASWAYSEMQTPWEGAWKLYGSAGGLRWSRDRIEVFHGDSNRVVAVPSRPSDHTIAPTFAEFDQALAEGRAPRPDIADNMQTVAMVFGAIRSHESRAPVSVGGMVRG